MKKTEIVIGQLYENPDVPSVTYMGVGVKNLLGKVCNQDLIIIDSPDLTMIGRKVLPYSYNTPFWEKFKPIL